MERSHSWEANSLSASQEIPRLLWKTKVRYRVHKSASLGSILRHVDLADTLCFLKIHFNITIMPARQQVYQVTSSFYLFLSKPFAHFVLFSICDTFPVYLVLLDIIILFYFFESSKYEAPHFVIFSILLSLESRYLAWCSVAVVLDLMGT